MADVPVPMRQYVWLVGEVGAAVQHGYVMRRVVVVRLETVAVVGRQVGTVDGHADVELVVSVVVVHVHHWNDNSDTFYRFVSGHLLCNKTTTSEASGVRHFLEFFQNAGSRVRHKCTRFACFSLKGSWFDTLGMLQDCGERARYLDALPTWMSRWIAEGCVTRLHWHFFWSGGVFVE